MRHQAESYLLNKFFGPLLLALKDFKEVFEQIAYGSSMTFFVVVKVCVDKVGALYLEDD